MEERILESHESRFDSSRKRHGFVTFWLRLGMITSILCLLAILSFILDPSGVAELQLKNILWIIGLVATASSYYLLLKWRKVGFIVFAMSVFFNCIDVLLAKGPVVDFLLPFVSLIILYAVLQIKKDGLSCWEQLKKITSFERFICLLFSAIVIVVEICSLINLRMNSMDDDFTKDLYQSDEMLNKQR